MADPKNGQPTRPRACVERGSLRVASNEAVRQLVESPTEVSTAEISTDASGPSLRTTVSFVVTTLDSQVLALPIDEFPTPSPSEASAPTSTTSKRRAVLSFDRGRPTVSFLGNTCTLNRRESALVNFLYDCQTTNSGSSASFRGCFAIVFGDGADFRPERGRNSPNKLSQFVCRLNRKLNGGLGPPPGDRRWIDTDTTVGYGLASSVIWQQQRDWKESAWNSHDRVPQSSFDDEEP